jgi:hypothetical protein
MAPSLLAVNLTKDRRGNYLSIGLLTAAGYKSQLNIFILFCSCDGPETILLDCDQRFGNIARSLLRFRLFCPKNTEITTDIYEV